MIWRDDDISVNTKIDQLRACDDLFQANEVKHTIAVLAYGMRSRPDLVELIKERKMDVQLHGWHHDDLTRYDVARMFLEDATDLLEELFEVRPTVLYPPWNRTNAEVNAAAAALGLEVSTKKTSLEHYIRHRGEVEATVVNFHYWSRNEMALLPEALAILKGMSDRMKVTDYGPRVSPFDEHLRYGRDLVGLEIGVDAGAHAEALLDYLDIKELYLLDPWPNPYYRGLCEGRLLKHRRKIRIYIGKSENTNFDRQFDFIYCDLPQDGGTASAAFNKWWPALKPGGLFGYRNYSDRWPDMKAFVDSFVAQNVLHAVREIGEIVIWK